MRKEILFLRNPPSLEGALSMVRRIEDDPSIQTVCFRNKWNDEYLTIIVHCCQIIKVCFMVPPEPRVLYRLLRANPHITSLRLSKADEEYLPALAPLFLSKQIIDFSFPWVEENCEKYSMEHLRTLRITAPLSYPTFLNSLHGSAIQRLDIAVSHDVIILTSLLCNLPMLHKVHLRGLSHRDYDIVYAAFSPSRTSVKLSFTLGRIRDIHRTDFFVLSFIVQGIRRSKNLKEFSITGHMNRFDQQCILRELKNIPRMRKLSLSVFNSTLHKQDLIDLLTEQRDLVSLKLSWEALRSKSKLIMGRTEEDSLLLRVLDTKIFSCVTKLPSLERLTLKNPPIPENDVLDWIRGNLRIQSLFGFGESGRELRQLLERNRRFSHFGFDPSSYQTYPVILRTQIEIFLKCTCVTSIFLPRELLYLIFGC